MIDTSDSWNNSIYPESNLNNGQDLEKKEDELETADDEHAKLQTIAIFLRRKIIVYSKDNQDNK